MNILLKLSKSQQPLEENNNMLVKFTTSFPSESDGELKTLPIDGYAVDILSIKLFDAHKQNPNPKHFKTYELLKVKRLFYFIFNFIKYVVFSIYIWKGVWSVCIFTVRRKGETIGSRFIYQLKMHLLSTAVILIFILYSS